MSKRGHSNRRALRWTWAWRGVVEAEALEKARAELIAVAAARD